MFDGYCPGHLVTDDQNTAGVPAGTATLSIAPPVGEMWLVLACSVFHNDSGGNKVLSFNLNDGVTDVGLYSKTVAAGLEAGIHLWPDAGVVNMPLALVHGESLNCNGAAIAGDKLLYMRIAYRVLKGAYNSV